MVVTVIIIVVLILESPSSWIAQVGLGGRLTQQEQVVFGGGEVRALALRLLTALVFLVPLQFKNGGNYFHFLHFRVEKRGIYMLLWGTNPVTWTLPSVP